MGVEIDMKKALVVAGALAALFIQAYGQSVLEIGYKPLPEKRVVVGSDRVEVTSNKVEVTSNKVEVASNRVEVGSDRVEVGSVGRGVPDAPKTNATSVVQVVGRGVPDAPKETPKETKKKATRPARITADTTVYNRKEGIASFLGHVHVDDEQYQMHADRVFLFMETNDVHRVKVSTNDVHHAKGTGDPKSSLNDPNLQENVGDPKVTLNDPKRPYDSGATNEVRRAKKDKSKDKSGSGLGSSEVRRIVALGHVAMTNEMRRAYGAKATYSKKQGLVVLYSGDGITAEVRDESKAQPQIVRGKRIRFWLGTEQVEVDEADLTGGAPSGGAESLKKALGR